MKPRLHIKRNFTKKSLRAARQRRCDHCVTLVDFAEKNKITLYSVSNATQACIKCGCPLDSGTDLTPFTVTSSELRVENLHFFVVWGLSFAVIAWIGGKTLVEMIGFFLLGVLVCLGLSLVRFAVGEILFLSGSLIWGLVTKTRMWFHHS